MQCAVRKIYRRRLNRNSPVFFLIKELGCQSEFRVSEDQWRASFTLHGTSFRGVLSSLVKRCAQFRVRWKPKESWALNLKRGEQISGANNVEEYLIVCGTQGMEFPKLNERGANSSRTRPVVKAFKVEESEIPAWCVRFGPVWKCCVSVAVPFCGFPKFPGFLSS